MRKTIVLSLVCGLTACSGVAAYKDHYFYLNPPTHMLQGPTPKDDKDESKCDPQKSADGTKVEYQCVVHFMADYEALLKENDRLSTELKACQEAHH